MLLSRAMNTNTKASNAWVSVFVWTYFKMWILECRIWCHSVYIVIKLIAKIELFVYTLIGAEATIAVIKLIINRLSLVEQSTLRRSHSKIHNTHPSYSSHFSHAHRSQFGDDSTRHIPLFWIKFILLPCALRFVRCALPIREQAEIMFGFLALR